MLKKHFPSPRLSVLSCLSYPVLPNKLILNKHKHENTQHAQHTKTLILDTPKPES